MAASRAMTAPPDGPDEGLLGLYSTKSVPTISTKSVPAMSALQRLSKGKRWGKAQSTLMQAEAAELGVGLEADDSPMHTESGRKLKRMGSRGSWSQRIAAKTRGLVARLLPETEATQYVTLDMPGDSPSDKDGGTSAGINRMHNLPSLCHVEDFRVLDRNGSFGQSLGQWAVNNVYVNKFKALSRRHFTTGQEIEDLVTSDIYHTFLDTTLKTQLLIFAGVYIVCFTVFAVLYLIVEDSCGLALSGSFIKAYLLALESMITIGYGVPDPYLNGCWEGAVILTVQSLLQLVISSFLIGIIFQSISQPQKRAHTIIFSETATINRYNGALYFMFRVFDIRVQHTLIEPQVRAYCVQHSPERGWVMLPMRLEQPDDSLGSSLCLNLPSVIVHRIDRWSPLVTTVEQKGVRRHKNLVRSRSLTLANPTASASVGARTWAPRRALTQAYGSSDLKHLLSEGPHDPHDFSALREPSWPGTFERQVDCEVGGRDSCVCPTCGESFQTVAMLQLHCRYNASSDEASGIPEDRRHKELSEAYLAHLSHHDPTREEVEKHLKGRHVEVVVLVEGIETTTSATLQARHSYVMGRASDSSDLEAASKEDVDFLWDMNFIECCSVPQRGSKGILIDLEEFHTMEPRPNKD